MSKIWDLGGRTKRKKKKEDNMTIQESNFKNKFQSITYHLIHKVAARDGWRTAYVNTNKNDAD